MLGRWKVRPIGLVHVTLMIWLPVGSPGLLELLVSVSSVGLGSWGNRKLCSIMEGGVNKSNKKVSIEGEDVV
jgi:hypothetical protein